MPYQSDPNDFEVHPAGQHEGIVYLWRDKGLKPTSFGDKHRAVIGIESMTAMKDDGRPYVVAESVNIAFGENARLRERRVQILGRPLEGEEKWQFNPREILEARVGYVVRHNPRENGDGVWANIDALWRLEDQSKGELHNEVECLELEDPAQPSSRNGNSSGPDPDGDPGPTDDHAPAPDVTSPEERGAHEYAVHLVETLHSANLITQEQAEQGFKKIPELGPERLQELIQRWEAKLKDAGIDPKLPEPAPTNNYGDDLPF